MGFKNIILNPYVPKESASMNSNIGSGVGSMLTNPNIIAKLAAMFGGGPQTFTPEKLKYKSPVPTTFGDNSGTTGSGSSVGYSKIPSL